MEQRLLLPVSETVNVRRKEKLWADLIAPLLGGGLALALITPKGLGAVLALVFLASLFSIRPSDFSRLHALDRSFLLLINIYPLMVASSMLQHGFLDAGYFDNASRFLLFSVVYVALRSRPFDMRYVVIGAMIGTSLTFGMSVFFLAHGSPSRFGGFENPIVFAQIAFFLLLVAATPIRLMSEAAWRAPALLVVLVLMASTSLVASQSRSVLMALFVLCAYLLFFDYRFPAARAARFAVFLLGAGAVIYLLNASPLYHLGQTASELIANYGEIDQQTSLGQRLALWASSWQLVAAKPFFGWGIGQFNAAINSLPQTATLSEKVLGYGHAHNDFIHLAVEQGLVGVSLFVASLVAIVVLAVREAFSVMARYLLVGATAGWMFVGLTQTQLAHQKTTMMFALLLTLGFSCGMNMKYGPLNVGGKGQG